MSDARAIDNLTSKQVGQMYKSKKLIGLNMLNRWKWKSYFRLLNRMGEGKERILDGKCFR